MNNCPGLVLLLLQAQQHNDLTLAPAVAAAAAADQLPLVPHNQTVFI
jgi:hypothetical protein